MSTTNKNKITHDEFFLAQAEEMPELTLARVISQYKGLYKLATADIETLAEVSGNFRYHTSSHEGFPAVGDYVMAKNIEPGESRAIIERVLDRKSVFKRAAVGADEEVQVIAANVDLLFICMALNADFNINRLERYLSVAWESGAMPVIILTKADLCEDVESVLSEVSLVALGVEMIITSNTDADSYDAIKNVITEETTASFVGSSGVGKSTIVNYLLGEELLQTADIREDGKGRHTTTNRELFILSNGGAIIDTPGMRELGMVSADLSKSFSDIEELAAQCRFNDCSHVSEPGCAIKAAIERGDLSERRFASYQKLRKEMNYEGLNSRQIEEMKIQSMMGGFGEAKRIRNQVKQKNKRR